MCLKWKHKANHFPLYDLEHVHTMFKEDIRNHFESLYVIDRDLEELWNKFKEVVKIKCEKGLPKTKKQKKLNWMSEQKRKWGERGEKTKLDKDLQKELSKEFQRVVRRNIYKSAEVGK